MLILTRRRVLRWGAAALVAAPFVRLLARESRAASTGTARRLFTFFTPDGVIPEACVATGSDDTYEIPSTSLYAPLAAHRDRLLLLGNLALTDAVHHEGAMKAVLTNNGDASSATGGASLDQYVASRIGTASRFSSLELGVQTSMNGGSNFTRISYAAAGEHVAPDDDPLSVYARLYGDALAGPEEARRLLRRRQSVIDLVMGEVSGLRRDLGAQERALLDAHLESLRDLERALTPSETCSDGETPASLSIYSNDAFPSLCAAQIGLAVQALACEATPVVTLQLSTTLSATIFSWLGHSLSHHSLSHAPDSTGDMAVQFVECGQWWASQFGAVLDGLLAAVDPETGAPLLDDTVVLWARELGAGRDHDTEAVPWVIGGDAGGAFTTGRALDLDGTSHGRVMVSICQALGLTNDTFGDPDSGDGPCEELA